MTAFKGVRSSVAHVGQKPALGPGGFHRLVTRGRQALDQVGKLGFTALDLRDVGVDAHDTSVVRHHLIDFGPDTAAETDLNGGHQVVTPPGEEFLGGTPEVREHAALEGGLDDGLAIGPGYHKTGHLFTGGVGEIPLEIAVAQNDAVFRVVDDEALGDRLDRLGELDACMLRLIASLGGFGGSNRQHTRALFDSLLEIIACGPKRCFGRFLLVLHFVERGDDNSYFVTALPIDGHAAIVFP